MGPQDRAASQFLEQDRSVCKGTACAPECLRNQDAQPAKLRRLVEEFRRDAGGSLFQGDQGVFIVLLTYEIGCRRPK